MIREQVDVELIAEFEIRRCPGHDLPPLDRPGTPTRSMMFLSPGLQIRRPLVMMNLPERPEAVSPS